MSQILLILAFVLVTDPDLFGPPMIEASPWLSVAWSLGLLVLLVLIAHVAIGGCVRVVDRSGSWNAIRRGERIARITRVAAIGIHGFNILGLGWVMSLRELIGDIPLLIEILAVTPPLAVWAASWWSVEPLERRVREAALVRDLDAGTPVYPIQSRAASVWMSMRHQVFVVAVPIVIILGWGECVWTVASVFGGPRHGPRTEAMSGDVELVAGVVQLVGVASTLTLMPAILRRVWPTTPLGPGPLRDTLLGLCQQSGVRVRELLVWRTNGQLINGAAVGLIHPLRYIMLTDGLLDRLSQPQIEAVAAHEIAHIRRHHMFWLGACTIGGAIGLGTIAELILRAVGERLTAVFGTPVDIESLSSGPLALVLLVLTLGGLGLVSRRFEWQADAFAVSVLSRDTGITHDTGVPDTRITAEAVHVMSSALGRVAALNGLSARAPSWRHGSIATRQSRLKVLVGRSIHGLPIDRVVRRIQLGAVIAIALGLVISALSSAGFTQRSVGPSGGGPSSGMGSIEPRSARARSTITP